MKPELLYSDVFVKIQQAIDDGYRFILLPGGSRSSKTMSLIQTFIKLCLNKNNQRLTVIRKERTTAEETVWDDFKGYLKEHQIWDDTNANLTKLKYNFNHNSIEFIGLDKDQKAHGRKQQHAWFNEAMEITWNDWKQIVQRTPGIIFADWNPTNDKHFLYTKIMKNPKAIVIHSTMLDNPFLEDELIEEIRGYETTEENIRNGTASAYDWDIYGLGKPAKREGLVYNKVKQGEFVEKYPGGHYIDHGFHPNPLACGKITVDTKRKRIYIKENFTGTQLGDDDVIRLMGQKVPKSDIVIADTSDGRMNHALREEGWEVLNADKRKGTIVSGIKAMTPYTLIIDPDSPNVISDFNNYIWHNKMLDTPKKENDHHPDGVRYLFTYLQKMGLI
jgi:PBSX family phage terminase large subunit